MNYNNLFETFNAYKIILKRVYKKSKKSEREGVLI
jgi:hypothetical protein